MAESKNAPAFVNAGIKSKMLIPPSFPEPALTLITILKSNLELLTPTNIQNPFTDEQNVLYKAVLPNTWRFLESRKDDLL